MSALPIVHQVPAASLAAAPTGAPVLVVPTPGTRVRRTDEPQLGAVSALAPDVDAYVRDAADGGLTGAAVRRLRSGGPGALVRVAATALGSPGGVATRRFDTLLRILLELELAGIRSLRPQRVILAAGITDLVLAAGNARFFHAYARHVRRFHRAEPWLDTRNAGHLLPRLRDWDVPVAGVLTPLNPRGLGTKPDLGTCLEHMDPEGPAIWARDVTAGGAVPFEEGAAFAAAHGATAIVTELQQPVAQEALADSAPARRSA